ncbi:serine/threonine protein kinase [Spirulina subsalsa FACHB-351]|uniref:Serine/threonine protein kinase n=1 Tax=Spirulina subsalsa FACHB-351 TaxID=234711 RepID=A0ABT3L2E2_9CYAN|nr:serine/threonine-protein kinase [Spirulina subsalsa]MCW6035648.1 serine/threonine protein kinase [Spirulina subsalsa FACHB-351]
MIHCLNRKCTQPQNPPGYLFCSHCGSKLRLCDRYSALEPLLEGSRTFYGVDEGVSPSRPCVIKQIAHQNLGFQTPEAALDYFRQEAAKLQVLGQHPQIPQLFAYIEQEPTIQNFSPSLVQEYIAGQSIEQEVFTEGEIRQLLNEVLPLLQFIHDHQIIHRDLNPQNLIRQANGHLVLVDFSAAKITRKTALAQTGTLIGSAAYSAPEQLRGKATYASDLYSLGVLCIHLLTGFHPFDLFSTMEGIWVWESYLADPVSDDLRAVLNKLLAESLNLRYACAQAVYQDLNPGKTLVSRGQTLPISVPEVLNRVTPRWQCVQTLEGHHSSVHSLAFFPGGQELASAGADREILRWNLQQEHPQPRRCSGHRSIIDALVIQPETGELISGSWDYTIRFWQEQQEVKRLEAHAGWIHALALSPDGGLLVSGSSDRTLKLWHLPTGELRHTLKDHDSAIYALAVSPDGQKLASGSGDRNIRLWNLQTGELLHRFTGHTDKVTALAFSPSSQLLYSGSADQCLKTWHCTTGKLIHSVNESGSAITCLALNRAGNLLVTASEQGTLTLWHPGKTIPLITLSGHEGAIRDVAFSPTGLLIATASQDQTVKLWQVV